MESTMAMQAVQPRVKDLQAKYANEPETLQVWGSMGELLRQLARGSVRTAPKTLGSWLAEH
jgi:membrane protein insertase Oxa1/YidC/SpoIIIJ